MKKRKNTLYIGLFDKDTKKQEIKTEKAKEIVNNILLQYTQGATVYIGNGIYRHIDNTTVTEPNLISVLYMVNKKTIKKIIQEIGSQLNQETILNEQTRVRIDFVEIRG